MARSLNKVTLIGNLTADIELRKTPNDASVCSFSIATNRTWTESNGEKREDTQFHRLVAWQKLAELCGQLLHKGDKVYIEGRLETHEYEKDGDKKYATEIIVSDMIVLSPKKDAF